MSQQAGDFITKHLEFQILPVQIENVLLLADCQAIDIQQVSLYQGMRFLLAFP